MPAFIFNLCLLPLQTVPAIPASVKAKVDIPPVDGDDGLAGGAMPTVRGDTIIEKGCEKL